jgi:hypothetical protein
VAVRILTAPAQPTTGTARVNGLDPQIRSVRSSSPPLIWGWRVRQYPFCFPSTMISEAAVPSATSTSVLVVFGVAVLLELPASALVFTLAQRSVLGGEGKL